MTDGGRTLELREVLWLPTLLILVLLSWPPPTSVGATEIVFLEGGRTIQADRVQFFGDRVHIERGTKTIQVDRSAVLSIHRLSRPVAFPNEVPPAEVYRNLAEQMTEKVRRDIQERLGASRQR